MSLIRKLSELLFKFYPVDKKKIVIVNGEDELTILDKTLEKELHAIDKDYQLCKIVNLKKEGVDFKKYPVGISLADRNTILARRDIATARIIIDLKMAKSFCRHGKNQLLISIPGKEIEDINYMAEVDCKSAKKRLDFCVCRSDKAFTILTAAFANCVQLLKYGDPTKSKGEITSQQKRLIKLLTLILTCRDSKYFDLFRRLNLGFERYKHIGIHHNYFGMLYCMRNKCFKKYLKVKFCNKMIEIIRYCYKSAFSLLPIKKNRIVVRNFQHKYGCNPKYITEELLRRDKKYEIIWIVDLNKNSRENFPSGVKVVHNNTFASWKALCTAKVWIDNNVRAVNAVKKDGQFYIQTWHGSMGIKKFDSVWPQKVMDENDRITDVCISNSAFETEVYKTTAWPNVEVMEFGHPRNDILFVSEEDRQAFKRDLLQSVGLDEDTKILLYAPTFRDEHLYGSGKDKTDFTMYLSAYDDVFRALKERFGGKWIIFERMHYHIKNGMGDVHFENVIDMSQYNDMQELILAADIALTDYSSWIYDFALTGRPGFILAKDKEHYLSQRKLYFPLESTPFPVAYDQAGFVQNILSFDEGLFDKKLRAFLGDKGCVEEGKASCLVVDLIESVIL